MRTKQINVSIPDEAVPILAAFDIICKDMKQSRSETLIELMMECVEANQGTISGPFTSTQALMDSLNSPEHDEHASNDPLPEWMI